jgi:hypothetical protein
MSHTRLTPERVCSGAQRLAVEGWEGGGEGGRGEGDTRIFDTPPCVRIIFAQRPRYSSVCCYICNGRRQLVLKVLGVRVITCRCLL